MTVIIINITVWSRDPTEWWESHCGEWWKHKKKETPGS